MTGNHGATGISRCEVCSSLSGLAVEYHEAYRVPDEYEFLCTACAKRLNTHTADDLSDEELIAAIVDDSIGYASPAHAAKHVRDTRSGEETAYCERGVAVFEGDLDALIESARRHWLRLQTNPEKVERLLESVEEWREVEEQNPAASLGISCLYPTHGVGGGGA